MLIFDRIERVADRKPSFGGRQGFSPPFATITYHGDDCGRVFFVFSTVPIRGLPLRSCWAARQFFSRFMFPHDLYGVRSRKATARKLSVLVRKPARVWGYDKALYPWMRAVE